MSFLTQSHQVFFGRPLYLIPSTFHVIQRLTQSLSTFRQTCPNHLNLLFLITKLTGSNPKKSSHEIFRCLSFIQLNPTYFAENVNRPEKKFTRSTESTHFVIHKPDSSCDLFFSTNTGDVSSSGCSQYAVIY